MKRSYPKQIISSFLLILVLCAYSSCSDNRTGVDYLFYNGTVYLVDSGYTVVNAIAIKDNKIVAVGSNRDIQGGYKSASDIDLDGKTVYPGFVDAHCHFFAYGQDLQELNLKDATSFEDMIQKTINYAQGGEYSVVVGRGWNEENWEQKTTPSKFKLDALFPYTPVVLQRVDGHAVLCNQAALDLAGIDETTEIEGGKVVKMGYNLTGMLVDKAADAVFDLLPDLSRKQKIGAILNAQQACTKVGLTTVSDAGLNLEIIDLIDSLSKSGDLKMRVYSMANPNQEELDVLFDRGIQKDYNHIVRSVKLYCDGALGSRGALLKQPYCDEPEQYGLLQNPESYYRDFLKQCYDNGFQVNTHCIGDSANALMLGMYGELLKGGNDLRWRIEHAQVVDPVDVNMFGDYNIIPSVQPTHATSDMYMARERLCTDERLEGAYSYETLKNQNGMIAFGTDFPVEDIDPLGTYFSAVERKSNKGDVFRKSEGVNSTDAIRAMTQWAAYSNFMEEYIGSLEVGKQADLIIMSKDLSQCTEQKQVKNIMTMINGEVVYNSGIKFDIEQKQN